MKSKERKETEPKCEHRIHENHHELLHIEKTKTMIVKRTNMVDMPQTNARESIIRNNTLLDRNVLSDSKDEQKKLKWASALKHDQLKKEYQMEMDKKTEMKKKKNTTTLTQRAIPPKYQIKLAQIIATTTRIQAPFAA
uniref:Uncharacterized protein n=1 Tax=Romanomermis culicivorax TaxID=13658 RepID=A0A915J604_ROMCU